MALSASSLPGINRVPDEHIKIETEKFYDIINMFYRTIKCYFWKCK